MGKGGIITSGDTRVREGITTWGDMRVREVSQHRGI